MIVAVAGDDARLRQQVSEALAAEGYQLLMLSPGLPVPAVRAARPSLLVLLARGADEDVLAQLKSLRESSELRRMPVLCVDPRASSADGVALLDAGADDVIHRPFQTSLLLARARSLLRRSVWAGEQAEQSPSVLSAGAVELRMISRQASLKGKALELTRLEFDLLAHFLRHPGRAFKREELLAAVWNYPESVETRTLDKHVESLRRKLGPSGAQLKTVHGVGYKLEPEAARA